eukprot:TRINITY_DN3646_c0_g1_i2.p4 TRINITY_DN3646_c0_g1~~TRINITY_DN3646_c0_g1_i2.p4  ORF type:complete len:136 (+),score=83.84 TRINITY_DN3646_c0_g1_i2:134-541(+)
MFCVPQRKRKVADEHAAAVVTAAATTSGEKKSKRPRKRPTLRVEDESGGGGEAAASAESAVRAEFAEQLALPLDGRETKTARKRKKKAAKKAKGGAPQASGVFAALGGQAPDAHLPKASQFAKKGKNQNKSSIGF